MQEEILTFKEACSFLKISHSTGYAWIKASRLRASRTGIGKKKGDYRILKSDCIAAVTDWGNIQSADAFVTKKTEHAPRSLKSMELSTAFSLSQVQKDLDGLLKQRTTSKLRRAEKS